MEEGGDACSAPPQELLGELLHVYESDADDNTDDALWDEHESVSTVVSGLTDALHHRTDALTFFH